MTSPDAQQQAKIGFWSAVMSYLLWGVLPIYWKQLDDVGAKEILAHRIFWSFVFLILILAFQRRLSRFGEVFRDKKMFLTSLVTTLLISFNWFVFVFAVTAGKILETSLGYFANPLFYVLLGVVFLGERLRPPQIFAVGLAAVGVVIFGLNLGQFPWISVALILSFGLYGFARKLAPMGAIQGLSIETFWLSVPALIWIVWRENVGLGSFLLSPHHTVLLAGAGLVTIAPLIFFNVAVRRIPLSIIGFCQYIAPTGSFLIAVFMYREPFDKTRLLAFTLVWLALVVFTADGIYAKKRLRPQMGSIN